MQKRKKLEEIINIFKQGLKENTIFSKDYQPVPFVNEIMNVENNVYIVNYFIEADTFIFTKMDPKVRVTLKDVNIIYKDKISYPHRTLAIVEYKTNNKPKGYINSNFLNAYPYYFLYALVKNSSITECNFQNFIGTIDRETKGDILYIENNVCFYYAVLDHHGKFYFYRLPIDIRTSWNPNSKNIVNAPSIKDFVSKNEDKFICIYKFCYPIPMEDSKISEMFGIFYHINDVNNK